MRAMEYTPVQCRCEPMGHWTLVRWCLIHDAQIEPTKKLTDAECAAEYWRAAHDTNSVLRNNCPECPGCQAVWAEELTWHRFATQPHASEVEA